MSLNFRLLLLGSLLLLSCRKERMETPVSEIPVAEGYQLTSLSQAPDGRLFATGGRTWEAGILLQSADAGASWETDSVTHKILRELTFDEDGTGWLTGFNGHLFYGEAATLPGAFVRLPVWYQFYDLCRTESEHTVFVSGEGIGTGTISVFGPDFAPDTIHHFDRTIYAIERAPNGVLHAAGFGIILRSHDDGRSWQTADIDGDFFRDIQFPTADIGYAVGSAGAILKTTDGGNNWEVLRNGGSLWVSNVDFRAIHFTDADTGYLSGMDGVLWRTTTGGERWEVITTVPDYNFLDVLITNGTGWLATREGILVRFNP